MTPTPYFNNASDVEIIFAINDNGLATVATTFSGYDGVATHADITIKLQKKFLFFWNDVDIGYPDDTYTATIQGSFGMHEAHFQLSSTGTYRAVVTVTAYGSGGTPDVIEYTGESTY
jgi:hypothetical protein